MIKLVNGRGQLGDCINQLLLNDYDINLIKNIIEHINNSLDIVDYVGKIICVEAKDAQEMLRSRKMRRVDIE